MSSRTLLTCAENSFDSSLQQTAIEVPLFFYTSSPFKKWKHMSKYNQICGEFVISDKYSN